MKYMIAKIITATTDVPVANAYNLKLDALNDAEDGKFEKLDKLRVDNVLNMM